MENRLICAGFLVTTIAATSCSRTPEHPTPGNVGAHYGPVTAQQLQGKHSVFATGTSEARFVWEFSADKFKITAEIDSIPQDVRLALLGDGREAAFIEGRWTLDRDLLTLTEITTDASDTYEDVVLHPFRSPVIRVDLNGIQYVFGPLP